MTKQLKEIEIPFGAKDSELCGWGYTIPEGMEATIVDNKIVVKKKESEDESIIRDIRVVLESSATRFFKENGQMPVWYDRAVSWLERQRTKKDEDEEIRNYFINAVKKQPNIHQKWKEKCLAWLEKQGEQKPVNTVEPKFKINDKVIHKETGKIWTIHWYLADTNSYYVIDEEKLIHHYTEDVLESAEQKPAEWSEKDEPQKELAETYLTVFDKKFPILPTLRGKQLADYKNFLNKCQQIFGLKYWGIRPLQAKLFEKLSLLWAAWGAEHLQGLEQTDGDRDNEISMWSEEDEKRLESIIEECSFHKGRYKHGIEESAYYTLCEKNISWLKSLKKRYTWKPSDEQLDALHDAAVYVDKSMFPYKRTLMKLYELLEKLREE